jgi:WD40 repeat protein
MSYCLNLRCQKPLNPSNARFCSNCGSRLLLGDRYRSVKPISQGGIGRTFLAVDEQDASKPRCIIKQFSLKNQGTSDPEKAAESFRQEVTRLQELGQHPQIPQLLACFEQDNRTGIPAALVQSFIEGQSLAQTLETEGAFSETQIRQLLNELLPVLQFVHDHGVIHRDINPNNIIRQVPIISSPADQEGQLVLVDFGAAKFTTKTALARTGTVIGSAAYTAQEQLMGKAVTSSDLYSLGVTCIHLLTHIHPFDLFNSLEGIWVWQDYLTDPVSNELSQILNKMLAGAVKHRYQSAEEILKDLNPHINPKTLAQSTTFTASGAPSTPKTLNPTWNCVRTLTGHLSSINAIAFSPDGQTLASGSADRTLKLWNPDSRVPRYTLSGHSSLIDAVAFSPDGRTLASGSWDHTIKMWNLETTEVIHTLCGHSGWIKSVVMRADGQSLASASADKTIKLWHLQTASVQTTLSGHASAVHCVVISPDGQTLASSSADQTIRIWNWDSGDVKLTLDGHLDAVTSLTFSPSGQILISGSADKTIKLWNLSRGTLLHTLNGHSDTVNSVAINTQGNLLISGSADKTIKIWHPGSGELLHTLCEHSAGVTAVVISPDSRRIASGSQDKTIKIWQFD